MVYPQMHRFILHPCASGGAHSVSCGEFSAATSILRFESFFTQKKVVVSFTFEVRSLPGVPNPLISTINSCSLMYQRDTGS